MLKFFEGHEKLIKFHTSFGKFENSMKIIVSQLLTCYISVFAASTSHFLFETRQVV